MNKCTELKLVHYANDSTAYDVGTTLETLTNRIYYELQKVYDRLCANKLSLNVSKSFFSIFSNMKNNFIPTIRIRGEILPLMSQTKFLGVIIDDVLRFFQTTLILYVKR